MTVYAQIRNKSCERRPCFCTVQDQEYQEGDLCVVESDKGLMLGTIAKFFPDPPRCIANRKKPLGKLKRKATPKDLECYKKSQEREKEAFQICLDNIEKHRIEMKLVNVEFLLDGSKATFYFTAEGRIDFRQLVKDLAAELHTRIEMKQIGVRDEAKIIGGYGACGRGLCCHTFLDNFEPVSIRMAKLQNLSLDPSKISGVCGRLMCCLEYEFSFYEQKRKSLPKPGENVTLDGEKGKVTSVDYIQDILCVEFPENRTVKVSAADVKRVKEKKR